MKAATIMTNQYSFDVYPDPEPMGTQYMRVTCPMPVCSMEWIVDRAGRESIGDSYGEYVTHLIWQHSQFIRYLLMQAEPDAPAS